MFMMSFAIQKLVNLIRSPFFVFACIYFALGDCLKKTLVQFMSENVLSMFLFRTLMVSCIVFKFLSYFEFIYYIWCERTFWIHWFTCSCQPSQPPLAEDTLFFVCAFLLCQKLIDCKCVSLFLCSLFCSICLLLCQCHAILITVALWYCLKSRRVLPPFSSGLLWQFWVL